MKHKTESWNGANTDSASSSVRRSLTRAGLQLGQLSHVVSGALGNLQGSASPRGAAQNRMRALLSQDRALLSHRACGQAALEDELEAPVVPVKGSQTRTAAQNRMRELLNQDRAMLAMREARRRENPTSEPIDDDFAAELVQLVDREWTPVQDNAPAVVSSVIAEPAVARGTCLGATTTFVAEPELRSVCTPGPIAAPASAIANATSAISAPVPASPAVSAPASPVPVAAVPTFAAAPIAAMPAPAVAPAAASSIPAAPIAAVPVPAAAPVMVSKPVVIAPPAPKPPAPSRAADSEEAGADPIRTRGMAKLLALQGYRDRALSIYDELIAAEPDNAELRAEADRLRN
jgi:hypothetical protein